VAYSEGARKVGHSVETVHLSELEFDPVLWNGKDEEQALEPDLVKLQEQVLACEHIVFAYPTWWGTPPALMKGMIDRVFLPGFAYRYEQGDKAPQQLLKGRSGRLMVTMDTPPWYYRLAYGAPGHKMMKRTVLGFSGIKPVRISSYGSVFSSTAEQRANWMENARSLGISGC
jgi:putative NADPH-quinone reductase